MPSNPLRVQRRLLEQVLTTIVECGGGRNECIVYVTGPVGAEHLASGFIHPPHAASPVSTEVNGRALDRVWDELGARRERIVLQIHSHPGAAHHSSVDDGWPVVHRVGFPSLVVARFGAVGLRAAHLAIHLGGGTWHGVERGAWSEHLVIDEPLSKPESEPDRADGSEGDGRVRVR